ncbi:MAG: hypothetical protein KKC68_01640 [Candidatus Thermoplasmatota archaeon]|nr:hypothetical protein [Candidatus Thermoplasmatota archaeon]
MKAAVLYGKEELNIESDFDDPVVKDSDALIKSSFNSIKASCRRFILC